MEPMRFSTGRDALDATIKRAFSIRSAAGLWKCGQGKRLDHSPTGEQKQKKRTFDVLPNPAKLISYRHHVVPFRSPISLRRASSRHPEIVPKKSINLTRLKVRPLSEVL